ncbi:MAG: glycosyltransferase, partial [Gammaproteobacteria bacterium]
MRTPIIGLGTNAWNEQWQTRQHVMAGLSARGWPACYSTGSFNVWDAGQTNWRNTGWLSRHDDRDGVRVYKPGRWQMRWPRVAHWDRFILRRHASGLRKLAGLRGPVPLVYVFHPLFWPLVDALEPERVVYHCDDNFRLMGSWSDELAEMEKSLIARADLILASSSRMAAALPGNPSVHLLPNGADAAAFASFSQCPSDLAGIPGPRIGYIGGLNDKVDFQLVADLATRRPEWQWIFIGQRVTEGNLSAETREGLARCDSFANVHFLGPRAYRDLPDYVGHMDVNTLCYRSTEGGWWTDVYPLKLHEYLATGRPVVGADIEVNREFEKVVAIAGSTDQWVKALEQALVGGVGTPAERRQVAAENSWDNRLDQLESWLFEITGS